MVSERAVQSGTELSNPPKDQKPRYFGPNRLGLVEKLSWYARKKMFHSLMRLVQPTSETTLLDVGITNDPRADSNFFEKLYPYPHNITAVGLEDASFLEREYPGLKFVQANGLNLPFADKSFDLVVAFAVVEHVGSRKRQKHFIHELCRVGRVCCVTTPNRWFPVEFHTAIPLIHLLPKAWFHAILRRLGHGFWANEDNLNLLSSKELSEFFPLGAKVREAHFKLLGLTSNLVFLSEQ